MTNFKDHFSGHADDYAAHRPTYPTELFEFLAGECDGRELAWDCATGSGQAAVALAREFSDVIATDASKQQLEAALPCDNVTYRVATAESSGLADISVDLITVAQALHWFDIDAFFAEAVRVLKPGGVLAVWSYELCRVSPAVDAVLQRIFAEVEDCWPPERQIVVDRYRGIEMPAEPIDVPAVAMTAVWTATQMVDYLGTWSASKRYRQRFEQDPIALHASRLLGVWGAGTLAVHWPLTLLACRK